MVKRDTSIRARRGQTNLRYPKLRKYLSDMLKTLLLHSVWPVTVKPDSIFFISMAIIYTLAIAILHNMLFYYLKLFKWFLPLLSLSAYLVYFYIGGYCYKLYFKIGSYNFYVYICVLSNIYSPIYIFLNSLIGHFVRGFFFYISFIINMIMVQYLIRSNIKNPALDQREHVIRYIVIFAVQMSGVLMQLAIYDKVAFVFQ